MRGAGPEVADGSVPEHGSPMVEVRVPSELSAKAQIGKRGFDARCAECHGPSAAGQDGVAPPLIHKVYEPSHHGDMSFLMAAKNGVRAHHWSFGNMPPIDGLTDADVANITLYVRELQRENGIQ
ncbi:c-type cytochrome [Tropicimonas sp. TH_r6]|uniref:c-type cytochrome n=1 Tax=Tropicimonas sp. TH_r6 TaxID=3082085 RepID=UPI002952FD65|nr:c-type cytochrome [Tropicimonas sp. TH_r6]MDV7144145.1 c-type cytochrome [Tropicimonas sp. TH_r6]